MKSSPLTFIDHHGFIPFFLVDHHLFLHHHHQRRSKIFFCCDVGPNRASFFFFFSASSPGRCPRLDPPFLASPKTKMVKLMVTLSPELGSDRNTIELDFVGTSEHRTIINQLASTFNVAERDKITDRLCFRLPERKRPLNTNDLLSDAIFGAGPRTIVLGLDYAKDFILNLTDPTQQKKSLFMIKKELSVRTLTLSLFPLLSSLSVSRFV